MQIKGKQFLVIGGAGFIGLQIVEQLLKSGARRVVIYDNFSRGSREALRALTNDSRVEVFLGGADLLHKDMLQRAMKEIDGVFHLAAYWLLQCIEFPRAAFDVNIAGTMNVIEAALTEGVKRIVYSSSASVYGEPTSDLVSESHPLNCTDIYGVSKACSELLFKGMYAQQFVRNSGMDFVGLRYMNVYGKGQSASGDYISVVQRFLNAIEAGEQPCIYGDGMQSYDFVNVSDCARANILAMETVHSNEFYNIGTGIGTSLLALAKQMIALYGSNIQPAFIDAPREYIRNRIGATANAEKKLTYSSRITLEDGLRELVSWRISLKAPYNE